MKFPGISAVLLSVLGCSSPGPVNQHTDAGVDGADGSPGVTYSYEDTYVAYEAGSRAYCQCNEPDNFEACLEGRLGLVDARVRNINACSEEANRSEAWFSTWLECSLAAHQRYIECNQACSGSCRFRGCDFEENSPRAERLFQSCLFDRFVGSTASACPSNEVTSSALGDSVFTGTTALMGDDFSPPEGCTANNRPSADVAFQWTAPSTGVFAVTVRGARPQAGGEMDTILYIQTSCDSAPIVCGDEASGSAATAGPSRVTFGATQGETYTIVVDTYYPQDADEFIVSINPAT